MVALGPGSTALAQILRSARVIQHHADAEPLRLVRWTPPQREWLSRKAPRKLLRAGNQLGKTYAGMAEVIWRALGVHPYATTRKPPVEIWVVCTSWSQSVAIMGKFWALVPKHQIKPSTRFDARYGFGRDNPSVIFLNGSIVRFRTTNQGPEALAGATIDYVHIDEPCDEDVYRELDRRVLRRGGQIGITLTPINRPCEWLHDLVKQGAVEEVHATLTQANLTPMGAKSPMRLLDGTPMDEAWIAEQRRITPATYAPVVLDGEWETSPEGVFFDCFDAKRHVSGRMTLDPRRGAIRWVLGIDYAAADRLFGLCAMLCQVQSYRDEKGHAREAVVACDEVTLPGAASTIEFARAVLLMLDRNGIRWSDLAFAHGDNPVESRFVPKSNVQTRKALAVELGVPYEAIKIRNAKDHLQSAGSFDSSCRYLYEVIASGRFIVHPRCETLIRALTTWDLKRTHPMKDVVDALRYALKPYAFPSERGRQVNVLLG